MNFAVVEYSSKTGMIWKHTEARPNFLADPQAEIDPTSFGCYVSAMKGEHIPLTWLLGSHRIEKRIYRKITGRWPKNYPLEYMAKFKAVLLVHDIVNGHYVTDFMIRLKEKYPRMVIIGVPTQPYGLVRNKWLEDKEWLDDFRKFMDGCDAFISIVADTVLEWKKLTENVVYYLPQPYPVEHASKYFKSFSEKDKIVYVAGVTDREDIKKGLKAAKILQKQNAEYLIHVTKTPESENDFSELRGCRFEETSFLPWESHLDYLSKVKIVINTDYTKTRGRVQVDCAAVGTPSVGANSDGQVDLWHGLEGGSSETAEKVAEKAVVLVKNQGMYHEKVIRAKKKMRKYNYENCAVRMIKIIDEVNNNRS